MASWNDQPDPHAGDEAAYAEAWESRLVDELEAEAAGPEPNPDYAEIDEAGQLGLGVPGEQRSLEGLGRTYSPWAIPNDPRITDNGGPTIFPGQTDMEGTER